LSAAASCALACLGFAMTGKAAQVPTGAGSADRPVLMRTDIPTDAGLAADVHEHDIWGAASDGAGAKVGPAAATA
ncbi:hypothetical protein ACMX2H_16310, partial [Arthrobacter sulfonylureivorans]|uniref:hypothetical protein n=1 Tax=Arthrobacter sulfonylureivorans TaxID=2486855 RepID=UPI0039E38893